MKKNLFSSLDEDYDVPVSRSKKPSSSKEKNNIEKMKNDPNFILICEGIGKFSYITRKQYETKYSNYEKEFMKESIMMESVSIPWDNHSWAFIAEIEATIRDDQMKLYLDSLTEEERKDRLRKNPYSSCKYSDLNERRLIIELDTENDVSPPKPEITHRILSIKMVMPIGISASYFSDEKNDWITKNCFATTEIEKLAEYINAMCVNEGNRSAFLIPFKHKEDAAHKAFKSVFEMTKYDATLFKNCNKIYSQCYPVYNFVMRAKQYSLDDELIEAPFIRSTDESQRVMNEVNLNILADKKRDLAIDEDFKGIIPNLIESMVSGNYANLRDAAVLRRIIGISFCKSIIVKNVVSNGQKNMLYYSGWRVRLLFNTCDSKMLETAKNLIIGDYMKKISEIDNIENGYARYIANATFSKA